MVRVTQWIELDIGLLTGEKMLESYVTPLLMSYVNKYIKNLKPSDLQLSLWGGDVVLSKLDLKLDVLEQVLHD